MLQIDCKPVKSFYWGKLWRNIQACWPITKTWWWPWRTIATIALFGPHLVQECHFKGTLKPHSNSKKWRGAVPLRTPPQGGTPALKIPPFMYILVPRRGDKPLVFLRVFLYLQFGCGFHHIFSYFFAQDMVSKASVTNYDCLIRRQFRG